MKNLLLTLALCLTAYTVMAACMGPFCYDESSASIGRPIAMQNYTVAQATNTAFAVGTPVFVTDAGGAGGQGTVCYSTRAVVNALVLSTGTACR